MPHEVRRAPAIELRIVSPEVSIVYCIIICYIYIMNTDDRYISELLRIISGAIRLDNNKVRNYSAFLADKLESDGEKAAANRIRQLLAENEHQLHPATIISKMPPVDGETRFSLLENVSLTDPNEPPLILSQDQRDIVNEFVSVAKSHAQFELHGLSTSIALLIYGPPGSGKNRVAREIARALNLKLFVARLDGLISSYLGSTSKNIRAVFEFTANMPCVLFLDEFDAIAKLRDDAQELGELKRVVNSFLQNLDSVGTQSVIIAATNHPHLLDAAVWRRFSYRLELKYPSETIRAMMWKEFLGPIQLSDHEIRILANLSEGFSGADIREICLRLRRQSIITKKAPTLKDAFVGLQRLLLGSGQEKRFLSFLGEQEPHRMAYKLRQRNPRVYTLSSVAAILGISKPTAQRWIKKGAVRNGRTTAE